MSGLINFEGEYVNGERNGKGKEYDENDNLLFEGEYLNGEWSKGKEYDEFGNIIFEGVFLNGKKWKGNGLRNGKGKEYEYDKCIFEGEYLNDLRNGKGKEYDYKGKLIFEGEYLNGEKLEK